MKLPILKYPDPVLARKAAAVAEITPELRQLAADMVETMYESEGIGLAAPQVGEGCRLIVVDVSGPEDRTDLRVLVNPEILTAEGQVDSEEGCLSVIGLRSTISRAERVQVRGLNLDGQDVIIDADGLLAICLQHEIDHLEGVLFIDRMSRLKRAFYDKKVKKCQKDKKSA